MLDFTGSSNAADLMQNDILYVVYQIGWNISNYSWYTTCLDIYVAARLTSWYVDSDTGVPTKTVWRPNFSKILYDALKLHIVISALRLFGLKFLFIAPFWEKNKQ